MAEHSTETDRDTSSTCCKRGRTQTQPRVSIMSAADLWGRSCSSSATPHSWGHLPLLWGHLPYLLHGLVFVCLSWHPVSSIAPHNPIGWIIIASAASFPTRGRCTWSAALRPGRRSCCSPSWAHRVGHLPAATPVSTHHCSRVCRNDGQYLRSGQRNDFLRRHHLVLSWVNREGSSYDLYALQLASWIRLCAPSAVHAPYVPGH